MEVRASLCQARAAALLAAPTPPSLQPLPAEHGPSALCSCALCSCATALASRTEGLPERFSVCPASLSQDPHPHPPLQASADPGLGGLPLPAGEDAWEDEEGSGERQSPSGSHLKGSGCSCVARPSAGPPPPLTSSQLWCWKEWAPEPCGRQRSAHSRAPPFRLSQKTPSRRKAWAPPRLPWELAADRLWGPAAILCRAELLICLVSAEWGLTWEPPPLGVVWLPDHCCSLPGSELWSQLGRGASFLLVDKTH